MFFSHYWRRREPPVSLSCPRFHCRFSMKVKILLSHTHCQKFATVKQRVWALLSFLVFIFPLELFSLHFPFKEALQSMFLLFFFRISGEAILGTQRYFKRSFTKHFPINIFSHLRRGDFRYTTILQSNQSMNRINESKQRIESMNRTS